jgi:WD40 repeat protein
MLASAHGREILLWNPANGKHIRTLEGCSASIGSLCAVEADGLSLLASGESRIDQVEVDRGDVDEDAVDCAVRLWNPVSGKQIRIFEGHSGPVTAVCSFSIRNRDLLASASDDKTVRVWNPASNTSILTIPVSYSATSMTWVNDSLVIGLDAGMLAIRLEPDQW